MGYSAPAPTATRRLTFAELAAANKPAATKVVPPLTKATQPERTSLATTPVGASASASSSTNPRAPAVAYRTRGTLPTSELTDADRKQQLRLLEDGFTTVGTAVSKSSCWTTWNKLHLRWFGESTPVVPITPESIKAVAAQMKTAAYRSFPNFVSAVKEVHLDQGYTWSADLERTRLKCKASTQRGIGPPKQCTEIDLGKIAGLELGTDPIVPDGPINPAHWANICAFHVLRGAESACALASSLIIDETTLTETFWLPASKTDPQARGCKRTWGCVCLDDVRSKARSYTGMPPCPYHSALEVKRDLARRFAMPSGTLPVDLPLFPDASGAWCARQGFVDTIRMMASFTGAPDIDELGRNIIGEHVWRVSGSRLLAGLGVPQTMIALLARWGSDVILRYIADAPLRSLTNLYREKTSASSSCSQLNLEAGAIRSDALQWSTQDALQLADKVLSDDMEQPEEKEHRFATNLDTRVVHIIVNDQLGEKPGAQLGRTRCNWDYNIPNARLSITLPPGKHRCGKCARPATWAAIEHDALDDD